MTSATVSQAVASRRSVRQFLDRPVDSGLLRAVLEKAARAPSGGNLQPWRLYVLEGAAMTAFKAHMEARLAAGGAPEPADYTVYPPGLKEPYRSHRFQVGEDMYALLGIAREDKAARLTWLTNNYRFFGAPSGLFCFVDRDMGPPQWSDLGMYLQTVMLLLQEAGVDSCAQESWAFYPRTVSEYLAVPPEWMLFCGLAMGYADPAAPVNELVSHRAPLSDFATFLS